MPPLVEWWHWDHREYNWGYFELRDHRWHYCGTKRPQWRPKLRSRQKRAIWERDGWTCHECGAQSDLEVDHIVPLVRGGSNDPSNLRTLCDRCNNRKSHHMPAGR